MPFAAVVTAEEAGFYKPRAEPYRTLREKLGTDTSASPASNWPSKKPPALRVLQAAIARAIALLLAKPAEAAALLARDGGQPQATIESQLAERETTFTADPAGIEGLGAFMFETKSLRAPAGRLDELTFRL